MASPSNLDLAIAVPTFVGSLLSFVATLAAIVMHMVNPPKRHFRHALIINLLVADFINAFNNTVSGAVALARGHKDGNEAADAACVANAWVGQFSVQAVDFNILIISIVVLYTVINSRLVAAESSTWATVALCVAAWVPGLITSFAGLAVGAYGHVSGNWCWIKAKHLGLRYGLTHGWRIAIFIATVAIYTYIYIRLRRMFGRFRVSNPSTGNTTSRDQTYVDHASDMQHILVSSSFVVSHELEERPPPPTDPGHDDALETGKTTFWSVTADDAGSARAQPSKPAHVGFAAGGNRPASKMPAPPSLKKMLLMNGYPIAYILLWLPGMINRLTESVGASPRWLQALQASTQFIGFVNAFTYGSMEHMRRASRKWKRRQTLAARGRG